MIQRFCLAITLCAVLPTAGTGYTAYFGNFHAHTAYSDGIGTPDEAYSYARDVADIDVLELTDHSGYLSDAEWAAERSTAAAYTQDGVFVALVGQEFGNLNHFGHMSISGSPVVDRDATWDLLGAYRFLQDHGAVGHFNHPSPEYGSNFNNLAFYAERLNTMTGLEVRNGLRTNDYEVQFIQALDNGWHVAPYANQDNHNGHWGDQGNPVMGGDIYLTGVLADELTESAITSAIRARRVYATEINPPSDRIALEFYADGQIMGSEIVCGAHLTLTGTAVALNGSNLFSRVELYQDGVIVEERVQIATSISWVFDRGLADGERHYYFVRVNQVDGDKTWSAPVWVTADVDPAAAPDPTLASAAGLLPCFPNPFTESTTVRFHLPPGPSQEAQIVVTDLQGRRVGGMTETVQTPGYHQWSWRASDRDGAPLPAGIYFIELRLGGERAGTTRAVLTR